MARGDGLADLVGPRLLVSRHVRDAADNDRRLQLLAGGINGAVALHLDDAGIAKRVRDHLGQIARGVRDY
jgi:hypothetical protein